MGYKGQLAIVSPVEFRKRTSLKMSNRSGTTLAMDVAYDRYHATRSLEARQDLYDRLAEYRDAHGGSWNTCDRNAVSGGLLEYLYEATYWKALSPHAAQELDRKAAARIREKEIPGARFGVLHLLANVSFDLDAVGMAIDGAGAIGGVIGAGMTTNYAGLGGANAVRAVQTVQGKGITAPQIALGGTMAVKVVRGILSDSAPPAPAATLTSSLPISMAALDAASAGLSEVWNKNKYLGAAAYAGAAIVAVPAATLTLLADAGRTLWDKLKTAIHKLGEVLMRAWRARYDPATAEKLGMLVKKGTLVAMDLIMKNAVPFLGGAIDAGTGLMRTIDEACTRIASWSDRRHIRIVSGHPQEIANSIEHQMVLGICGGLVDILKGAGKVAVSMFLPGLGSLVSVVMTAIDWLVRLLSRLGEQLAVDQFLVQARNYYDAEKRRSSLIDGVYQPNTEPGSIITDTRRFTDFFVEGCQASPLIPMLTLTSGLGGSLMTMINLFDANGAQSATLSGGRKEFDIGTDYFTRLKQYAVAYMKTSGFKFTHVPTDTKVDLAEAHDKSTAGFLVHAQGLGTERQSHVAPGTIGSQLAKALRT